MSDQSLLLYRVNQIREIEQIAQENFKISPSTLMTRAGVAAFEALLELSPDVQSIAVFCGKGNNGGDGYNVARLAHTQNIAVTVYRLCELEELNEPAKSAAIACKDAGVHIEPFSKELALDVDVVVDALLGIGLVGAVEGDFADAIALINECDADVLAIDIPSGLHADTGSVLGCAVVASLTISFIGMKQGLLTGYAPDYCGDIVVDELELGDNTFSQVEASGRQITLDNLYDILGPREPSSHKGLFGHVLVVGGDYGMPGAIRLSAEAAARAGAGLVTVATRPEHIAAIVAHRPELMCHGITDAIQLKPLLERATVVVIGPGLGVSDWAKDLFEAVIATDLPLVVDASGLHLINQGAVSRDNWIITPHPGEAGMMLEKSTSDIQEDRFIAAALLQKKFGGVAVLKGAGTIVQSPQNLPAVCDAGNPGMATAGMGDVLSGIIGAFVAQEFSLQDAACIGVGIHAYAGDRAAETGERGMLALDLMPHLRYLVNQKDEIMNDDLHSILEQSTSKNENGFDD